MSNMTLDEAIEHCKKVAKEQENCNVGCSLEHRELAIWLSALKAITENNYSTKNNMEKYIGTKVVKAEPMTMTEAQKVLGRELKPATLEEDGYLVEYKDGYKSWSPKSMFEEAYREVGSVNFGGAIDLLKAGLAVRRKGWNGKGLFIVKQVPSHVTGEIIPNMQSLPQSAKDILMSRENPHIDYTNQMLIINPDGRADSWVPSVSDVFAEDWEVVTE
jgi:hypothetical protein